MKTEKINCFYKKPRHTLSGDYGYFLGLLSMAALLFLALTVWSFASDLWVGGRPIHDLNDSTQTQIDTIETLSNKIDAEPHTPERFCGAHASPSFPTTAGDFATMTAYQATAGSDDWGSWLHLVGSTDVPTISGKDTYDIHEVEISTVSSAAFTRMQLGWDATTTTAIIANNTYTEVVFQPSGIGANVSAGPIGIRMPDITVGTLFFARIWTDGVSGNTVDFFIGTHEFDTD